VRVAVLLLDIADDAAQLLLRLFLRHAGLEPRDDVEPEKIAPRDLKGQRLERSPDVGTAGLGEVKARRQHADNFVALGVDRNPLTDDVGVGAEAPLPEAVTEDDETRPARQVFAFAEEATETRFDAEQREEACSDARRADAFGLALIRKERRAGVIAGHLCKA